MKKTISIVIIVILVALIGAFIGIAIYKNKNLDNTDKQNILTNEMKEDETESNTNNNSLEAEVVVNGKKIAVKMQGSVVEDETKEDNETFFKEKVNITIGDKEIESIITYAWTSQGKYEMQFPEVKKISDISNGIEYILIAVYPESIAGNASNSFIIYDDNGNKITSISDYAGTTYTLKDSEYNIPAHTIENNAITIIQPTDNGGAELCSYTIENGVMKSEIIKTYTSDDLQSAGKV